MDDREKLMERYDDAAFALMMDEYAEAEGEAILAEFRAAAEAGELPEMPEELDKACRNTIRREYARRERRVRLRQLRRAAARVAVAVFAVIGILSTLVFSVEAIRTPVLNFFMVQYEKYSAINGTANHVDNTEIAGTEYLLGLLPEDYWISSNTDTPLLKISMYENDSGDIVQFVITQTDGTYLVDTEDAVCSEVTVGNNKAMLIEEDGYQVIWYDEEKSIIYNFRATGFDKDYFLELSNVLAQYYQ